MSCGRILLLELFMLALTLCYCNILFIQQAVYSAYCSVVHLYLNTAHDLLFLLLMSLKGQSHSTETFIRQKSIYAPGYPGNDVINIYGHISKKRKTVRFKCISLLEFILSRFRCTLERKRERRCVIFCKVAQRNHLNTEIGCKRIHGLQITSKYILSRL